MTQTYNSSFVSSLQSRSNSSFGLNQFPQYSQSRKNPVHPKYDDYYFQILLFESKNDPPKLMYGTKQTLVSYYKLGNSAFPTSGVEIDQDFVKDQDMPADSMSYEYGSMTHWLLQTRKISQMIAYTWLDLENLETNKENKKNAVSREQVEYTRKILNHPRMDTTPGFINEIKKIEYRDQEYIIDDLVEKLPGIKLYFDRQENSSSLLIKPGHVNYGCLPLALLLCGQAFYKDENDQYKQIWEPIADANQLIVELGLDVSWDTFYGVITDRSSGGETIQYPYKTVTIPYPPRPSEFSLKQEQIKEWATAEDYPSKKEKYPFYPEEDDPDWKEHRTQFVNPPNPYLPLSCI